MLPVVLLGTAGYNLPELTSAVDGPSVVQLLSTSVSLSKDVALDVKVRLQSVRLIEVDNELIGELEDEELAGEIWLQLVRLDAGPPGVVTIEVGPLMELVEGELEVELLDSD